MRVKIDLSVLGQTKWHDYMLRFFFGGLVTAIAGVIAKAFWPVVGGLFLAFPAISPASATLIEKHEKQKKERRGLEGRPVAERRRVLMQQVLRWAVSDWLLLPVSCGN